jgi:hypothetical protein
LTRIPHKHSLFKSYSLPSSQTYLPHPQRN